LVADIAWRLYFKTPRSDNNKKANDMKCKMILTAALLLASARIQAQTLVTNGFSLTPATAISDGSPVGLTEQFTVVGLTGTIADVQLQLNISGGFNGDLYAYLISPQGQMAVLLNRVGVDGSNPFGYGDAGLNITLDGAATQNVHFYQSGSYTLADGQLTGTWAADGRNIDPQSAFAAFAGADTSAGLSLYNGLNGENANGAWTLFIADLASGGGTPVFNQAYLSIVTVPEPASVTLALMGGIMLWLGVRERRLLCIARTGR
jgi:subtilisin-like proprotein convertase family protein